MSKNKVLLIGLPVLIALVLSGVLSLAPLMANAQEAESHDQEESHEMHEDAEKIEQMEQLIAVLQQLIALLTAQASGETDHVHDDSHEHVDDSHAVDELEISVEVHGDRTHIHVHEPGEDEVKFFLDDLDVTEEDAIIEAIALEVDLSEDDVRAAATFPGDEMSDEDHGHADESEESDESEDHDMDDSEDEHEDDTEGIHIMSDGTVMLGNGEEVPDATITDDGMIMLADGELVEPEFDLR